MVRPTRRRQQGMAAAVLLCTVLLSLQVTSRTSLAAPTAQPNASSPTMSRAEALTRAQSWVDAKVPYNQLGYYQGYREDCVGLVSMAWGVATPGMGNTTSVFKYVTLISPDDLQPGDALVNDVGAGDPEDFRHIILFEGWVPGSNHTLYNGYQEIPGGARHSLKVPFRYTPGYDPSHYQPVRYKGITDPSQPSFYANKIVQWDGDHKTQLTSWLVTADLKRHWIPDSGTFYCLEGMGYVLVGKISAQLLDQLPDQIGNWATCSSSQPTTPVSGKLTPTPVPAASTRTPVPITPTPTATPVPPAPQTWTEQEGTLGANSFSNPHNASGLGPRLDAMASVQVSCKLYDPTITSVNPDGYWYRIASAPWNNADYIAATTFWNGDIPGHPPYTHNTDWNVANC